MKKKVWIVGAAVLSALTVGIYSKTSEKQVISYANEGKTYVETEAEVENLPSASMQTRAKSAYLMDFGTETPIYSENEKTRLPIASMCKIMTLNLAFDAIDEGVLRMDEEICVSERAASMGGSQVFLEANAKYSVRELIKSIVVCSANDSCVALAERIAGDESIFTDQMNEKAKELGTTDTLFANCTGLPKEPQYSCAKDVAIMLKELLSHEEYYEFGKVWMDTFQHPKGRVTEISNTNKLVRFYDGCDGGKTGFTNEAGFCLAATAKRNGMRIISVVIGEENSKNRFDDVRTMFDYAFANYSNQKVVESGVTMESQAKVKGGKNKTVSVMPERDSYVFTKRGEKKDVSLQTEFKSVKAPIQKGDVVGEIVVYEQNVEIDRISLLAGEDVKKANLFDCLKSSARGWTAK